MMLALMHPGLRMGFVFNPMTVMAFATLPRAVCAAMRRRCRPVPQYRRRRIGVSVTSFMLARGTQVQRTPTSPRRSRRSTGGCRMRRRGVQHALDPATRHGAAMLDQMINHQAQIIAFNNDYRLMTLVVVPPLFLLLLMRRSAPPPVSPVPLPRQQAA